VKNIWRILAKSLGTKSGSTDEEADKIAVVRLCYMLLSIITNICIIIFGIHHW
jgi:hypothetical protein